MTTPEYHCPEFEPLLDSYHDRELSSQEHAAVEKHLESCIGCQARLGEIERVVHSLKSLPRLSGCQPLPDLETLLRSRQRKRLAVVQSLAWGSIGLAAASVIAIACWPVILNMYRPESAQKPGPKDSAVVATALPNRAGHSPTPVVSGGPKLPPESLAESVKEKDVVPPASDRGSPSNDNLPDSSSELAVLPIDEYKTVTEAIGLSTDEDGLYALKM